MLRIAVVLLAALAAGCGESEEDRVEQVMRDYNRAYGEGDAEEACALTTEALWSDIMGTCEEFIERFGPLGDRDAARRLSGGDYDVTVDGDTATAEGHNLGIFTLRKVDGDWKLTSVR